MILSNDDVNGGKVRGWVTEELPEAEAPSTWIVLSLLLRPPAVAPDDITGYDGSACICCGSTTAERRSGDNHAVLYLFV